MHCSVRHLFSCSRPLFLHALFSPLSPHHLCCFSSLICSSITHCFVPNSLSHLFLKVPYSLPLLISRTACLSLPCSLLYHFYCLSHSAASSTVSPSSFLPSLPPLQLRLPISLCTRYELNSYARGTGCLLDFTDVFSGSRCTTADGKDGVYVSRTEPDVGVQQLCVAVSESRAGVRCCADADAEPPALSQLSCSDLGWHPSPRGSVRVCGASLVNVNNTCVVDAVPYTTAESICSARGARLCTYSELVVGTGSSTGCYKDEASVWTQTECGRCDRRAHVTVNYNIGGVPVDACNSDDFARAHVRCCADVAAEAAALTGTSCKTCGQLGWLPKASTPAVCADSEVAGASNGQGECVAEAISFRAAEQLCFDIGARLCSFEELDSDVAGATGCSLDDKLVWSRSPCGSGSFRVRLGTSQGDSSDSSTSACQDRETGRAYLRCCGDDDSRVSDRSCTELRARFENLGNINVDAALTTGGWSLPTDNDDLTCSASQLAFDAQGRLLPPQLSAYSGPRCFGNVSFELAERVCAANGARLCSRAELALHAPGTGCGFDGRYVMSSATCVTTADESNGIAGGEPGYIAYKRSTGEEKCVEKEKYDDSALRCCANEITPDKVRSAQSCEQLAWPELEFGLVETCGESEVVYDANAKTYVCAQPSVHADAEAVCRAAGARLCTYTELVAGEARGSGCGHDFRFVWSATPCGRCGQRKYLTYSYSAVGAQGYGDVQCRTSDVLSDVRCCADSVASLVVPTPAGSSTTTTSATSEKTSTSSTTTAAGTTSTSAGTVTTSASGTGNTTRSTMVTTATTTASITRGSTTKGPVTTDSIAASTTTRLPLPNEQRSTASLTLKGPGLTAASLTADVFVAAVLRVVNAGATLLSTADVTVYNIRTGSVIVDYAVAPSVGNANSVACILSHADYKDAVLAALVAADDMFQSATAVSATANKCTTCNLTNCDASLPTPAGSASTSGSSAPIIGGVVGGVLLIVIVLVVVVLKRRQGTASTLGSVAYSSRRGRGEGTVSFENPMCKLEQGGEVYFDLKEIPSR